MKVEDLYTTVPHLMQTDYNTSVTTQVLNCLHYLK